MVHGDDLYAISSSLCGDGWYNLCALIAQCTKGVQPHSVPVFNKSDSGQVRLIKPAIIHTHHKEIPSV